MKVPMAKRLPSGAWRVQIMVDGQRVSVTEDTEKKAVAKALASRERLIKEAKTPKDNITLNKATKAYIDSRDEILSPSTIRGYYFILEHRLQSLMKKKVCQIDEAEIQKAVNEEAKAGISCKSIKNAVGLVLAVLSEYKTVNSKRIKYPQKEKKEHPYLDAGQIVKLISACEGDIAEIPILLGIWLGLRRSEILGLQWESIDFERKKISVNRSVVLDKDGNIVLKSTMKNESSNRVLDCPVYILQKLEQYQPDRSKRTGTVFNLHPNTIYKNLKKICVTADIPFVGVHGLRHTNASVMLSLGIMEKIAMARGGWSSKETMERVYQHVFEADKSAADTAINDYFEGLIAHEFSHANSKGVETQGI